MRPFFPYYGSKWNIARHYPAPVGSVAEPFAGGAGYACFYNCQKVDLYDADPIIAGVWDFLIRTTSAEILALPDEITRAEDIARAIGGLLDGCVRVDVCRPVERLRCEVWL